MIKPIVITFLEDTNEVDSHGDEITSTTRTEVMGTLTSKTHTVVSQDSSEEHEYIIRVALNNHDIKSDKIIYDNYIYVLDDVQEQEITSYCSFTSLGKADNIWQG